MKIASDPKTNRWYIQADEVDPAWHRLPVSPSLPSHVVAAMCSANIPGEPSIDVVAWPSDPLIGPDVEPMTLRTRRSV